MSISLTSLNFVSTALAVQAIEFTTLLVQAAQVWATATLRALHYVCVMLRLVELSVILQFVQASIITEDGIHKEAEVVTECSLSTLRPGVGASCSTHDVTWNSGGLQSKM